MTSPRPMPPYLRFRLLKGLKQAGELLWLDTDTRFPHLEAHQDVITLLFPFKGAYSHKLQAPLTYIIVKCGAICHALGVGKKLFLVGRL